MTNKPHPFDTPLPMGDFIRQEAIKANKSRQSAARLAKRRAAGEVVTVPLVGRKKK